MSDGCVHQKSTLTKDIILIIIGIAALFFLREVLGWLFKANHLRGDVRRNRNLLENIRDRLERNGIQ